jgi:4-amino-4-deoxy-L-arabinose transferase-like glycosyltransferase
VTSPRKSELERRWGGPKVAFAAIVALAAALRLVGLEYGLPHGNLLNADEPNAVVRAWEMTHGAGADPHPFFDYPSLLLYVLAPFESWQEEPDYVAARVVAVVIGLLGVAAAWWLGWKAYSVVAGGVGAAATAVATVHVAYSRTAVADVLLTTLVTVALALLVSGRIELAGLVAGVAAAAKYPGVVVAVPILVVAWGRWRRVGIAAALAVAGFAAASPFAIRHLGEALGDAARVHRWARAGWLGFENDSAAPFAFTGLLWDALGPVLVIAAFGLVAALVVRAPADRALAAFTLAYFVTLMPLDSHFDRYVLPLVPVLGVLAGRLRAVAPVTLLLLVVPFTWSVRDTAELRKPDTREVALERVVREVGDGPLALDPGLPAAPIELVRLELPARWRTPDPRRDLQRLRAADVEATHVWVNGSVVDRVRAARDEYPAENRFYDALDRQARLVFRLDPDEDYGGPWTALYELPSQLASGP